MRQLIMGVLEWECTFCLCSIKSSHKLIVSYSLCTQNENEILKNEINNTCNETLSRLLRQMAQCFYLGSSLLGAEFVRGRVCQGPSLSGAEMSRNLFNSPGFKQRNRPIDPFPIIGFYLYHVISANQSNNWTTSGI